ncbi:MAG: hypothetical protein LW834_19990 [Cyanobium sp. 49614_E6]|nr:hypothetical protein [Cyanobium sp. 49614_E6]
MPIACSQTVLTGQDGSIWFAPAATQFCLLDNGDFPKGSADINVPVDNDFRLDDPVVFKAEGSGKLDTALTAGTTYYVVKRTATAIQVAATKGGTAILLKGDGGLGLPTGGVVATLTLPALPTATAGFGAGPYNGVATTGGSGSGATLDITVTTGKVSAIAVAAGGTGYKAGDVLTVDGTLLGGATGTNDIVVTVLTASALTGGGNTPGNANHVSIDYSDFAAICQVKSFSLDLSREEIDTTSLPCGAGGNGSVMASFRTMQAGYASGSGTMSVQFTSDQASLANRLLSNSMRKNQSGAEVRLYVNTVDGTGGMPDLTKSLYIEAPVSIMGFSISVSPEEVITAELNFSLSGQPTHLFV